MTIKTCTINSGCSSKYKIEAHVLCRRHDAVGRFCTFSKKPHFLHLIFHARCSRGCEKGVVKWFFGSSLACFGNTAAAVQPNSLWNFQNIFKQNLFPNLTPQTVSHFMPDAVAVPDFPYLLTSASDGTDTPSTRYRSSPSAWMKAETRNGKNSWLKREEKVKGH